MYGEVMLDNNDVNITITALFLEDILDYLCAKFYSIAKFNKNLRSPLSSLPSSGIPNGIKSCFILCGEQLSLYRFSIFFS